MSRNLEARIQKLEEVSSSGEIPNGGIVCIILKGDEAQAEAWRREMGQPFAARLSAAQRRRMIPVYMSESDAGL